jgi:hypothetical protein
MKANDLGRHHAFIVVAWMQTLEHRQRGRHAHVGFPRFFPIFNEHGGDARTGHFFGERFAEAAQRRGWAVRVVGWE